MRKGDRVTHRDDRSKVGTIKSAIGLRTYEGMITVLWDGATVAESVYYEDLIKLGGGDGPDGLKALIAL